MPKASAFLARWSLRLAMFVAVIVLISLTRGFWAPRLGRSLVCAEQSGPADAILVENLDPDYLLFERAQTLHDAGRAPKVFVTTWTNAEGQPSKVSSGIAELMARVARLDSPEAIPIQEVEPISLNAAMQIRAALIRNHVRSVLLVATGLRSRRSSLVYDAVMGQAGIGVKCVPVFGQTTAENWQTTWHGMQQVAEQFLKLQYYRFYVMPKYAWRTRGA